MGLPFQEFRLFRKISSGTNQKVVFHLQPDRNFQNFLVNGKRPLLPTSGTLLTPEFSLVNDAAKLCARKERQHKYFNRGKCVLSPVKTGETICVCSPLGTWRPAECLREVAPRSYEVLVDGAVRRRNQKDIW